MPKFRQTTEILKLMGKKEAIRNIGIIAHIDHGKTTMADSLLVGAGLLPLKMVGAARVLDYLKEEQRRGITLKNANISLLYETHNSSYVINLVDTPGHVDFTGKVSRALRAIDGAIVVVDAVEEIMAQTETVIRQALEERVKPILFINKMDRLIREIKLDEGKIQKKLARIIRNFNSLIEIHADRPFKKRWRVDPKRDSVVFGSALYKWGFTLTIADREGIKISSIIEAYGRDEYEDLARTIPLHDALLSMVVKNIPNPRDAQKYRIPKIWKGMVNSKIGKAALNCLDEGATVICITNVQTDPKVGLISTGRLFAGTIKNGDQVYLVSEDRVAVIHKVAIYMGALREDAAQISAGNIAALQGLDPVKVGETLVDKEHKDSILPLAPIQYPSEAIITIALEPKTPRELPRLFDAMNKLSLEDPSISTKIDENTGQYLIGGIGELQLDIAIKLLTKYTGGIELAISRPIVAYRESITEKGAIVMAQSPNKQNKFWIEVEPLEKSTIGLMEKGMLLDEIQTLQRVNEELAPVLAIDRNMNVLIDLTTNVKKPEKVEDSIVAGFHWACNTGPLCKEPMRGLKVKIITAQLHDTAANYEPNQISRAISRGILGSALTANPTLLEPISKIEVSVSSQWVGTCLNILSRKRGKISSSEQKIGVTKITGYIPIAETFGLSQEIRSGTSGHVSWQYTFDHWQKVPKKIEKEVIKQLRQRRGLPLELPEPSKFVDEIK